MATQEYAASIQGVSIRVTRLDAAGNLLNEAGDSYTTSAFMRISFTPEYEEGDEITEKSANGAICVSYKAPDTLKRITMELAICEPDPELTALISGGLLLRKNLGTLLEPQHRSIGWASPGVGDDPAGNGVAIEAWSFAVKEGKRAAVLPYFHWVFPYARLRQSGDRVIENGMLATTFEGYGLGNDLFGAGRDERWEFPIATERPYSYARSSWAPTGRNGFYTWHGELTAATTTAANTSDVATVTTGDDHGFVVGEEVTISGIVGGTTAVFNGTWTIASVPTATTFTFAMPVAADIVSAAAVGSAVVGPGSRAVTALPDEDTVAVGYNVPGGIDYNSDEPVDYVINSSENVTV
ncbi:MAG: hypothetical protein ACRC5T_03730 [Cetobacterium sp.]